MKPGSHPDRMGDKHNGGGEGQTHARMEEVEAEYHQTNSELIGSIIALTSNILSLIPPLSINPVLMSGINLHPEKSIKSFCPTPLDLILLIGAVIIWLMMPWWLGVVTFSAPQFP